jgi:hypothetical protein
MFAIHEFGNTLRTTVYDGYVDIRSQFTQLLLADNNEVGFPRIYSNTIYVHPNKNHG